MEQAQFVPPDPNRLMEFLDNWEKYYHSDELDPLAQLAIVHAQFEIIHPFVDGNGRLGRILIPLFLFEKGLLKRPTFYLSAWLEKHRDKYIDHLRPLGKEPDAWNRWIAFFLRGLDEQAQQNASTALAINGLYQQLKSRVLELTRSQFAVPLLDQMFVRPIFQSTDLRFARIQPSRPAIANLLKVLRDSKIIKVLREGSGSRSTKYVLAELLNLCEGRNVF
jgi:cell filamentation protein, protein adenylyltransferase